MNVYSLLLILIGALAALTVHGGEPPVAGPRFDQSEPVNINGSPSKKLLHAPYDDLYTTIMYSQPSIITRHSRALFIMFGGTGGRSHRYGIGSTMSAPSLEIRGLGGDVLAAQNPVYFQDQVLTDEQRIPIIDQFKSRDAQVDWMTRLIEFAIKPTLDADGQPRIPVYLYTRSSGTLLAGQLSDNYIQGKPGYEIMGKITGWIATGVLPHTPERIDLWMKLELEHLHDVEKELRAKFPDDPKMQRANDDYVRRIQKETFGTMTWASEDRSLQPRLLHGRHHPKVWMFLGAQDPEISLADQVRVAEDYSRLHPDLDITGIATPAGHNPAVGLKYRDRYDQEVELRDMKIMKPFLEKVMKEHGAQHPGLNLIGDFGLENLATCDFLISRLRLMTQPQLEGQLVH